MMAERRMSRGAGSLDRILHPGGDRAGGHRRGPLSGSAKFRCQSDAGCHNMSCRDTEP